MEKPLTQHAETRLLYQQSQLPIFQNRMYTDRQEAIDCPKGDVRLVENLKSGLVYNDAFRPELMIYDRNYQNEQAVSEPFRMHLETVSDLIVQIIGTDDLIEVGCGKGFFVELLSKKKAVITGFDPAYEGDNPHIRREYFQPESKMSGKGLILRHVLEHVSDPVAFLKSLRDANEGQGLIYIEVPCFDWICQQRAWFDIFYEHVNYFHLSDFYRMFGRVLYANRLFGGQYLAVIADLASLKDPLIDPDDRVSFPDDFVAAIPRQAETAPIVVWGAASKGVIFSLFCERAGYRVASVIDINPAKQGKYLSATGIRVRSPEDVLADLPEGSPIYVMNPNYLSEIRRMSNDAYAYIPVWS